MDYMVKNIENKSIKIMVKDEEVILPEEVQREIQKHWEDFKKDTPSLWNGELFCVNEYKEDEQTIEIICRKSNYAHYLYDERIGLPQKYACSSVGGGCLLETADHYYVIGELEENTSFPFCMQLSGGNVDEQDIKDSQIDVLQTANRELQEELGLDLNQKEQSDFYEIKYIELPEERRHVYMFFVKVRLKMTAKEVKNHYENYSKYLKENGLEIEFGKIHFIKKSHVIEELNKFKNPKRGYLSILLQQDSKEKN